MQKNIIDRTAQDTPQPTATSLQDLKIRHTRIAEIMHDVKTLVYPQSQDNLLLVCGPTGVGKSTLAHQTVDAITHANAQDIAADAGIIPAIYVEAPASGENEFSWQLFYRKILAQLDHTVASGQPRARYGISPETGRLSRPRTGPRQNLAGLRVAVERGLAARKTQLLVIDEAAHIIRQSSAKRLEIQLDTLKSLSNESGVQIMLIGAYDLYQLMSLSGQLSRRTHVLHFERYLQDKPDDVRAFLACIKKFQDQLPHLWGNNLMTHAAALHENTVGCIGTLSSVLIRTARILEENQKPGWSIDALQRSLLTDAQHRSILSETVEGEISINPGLLRTLPKKFASRKLQGEYA